MLSTLVLLVGTYNKVRKASDHSIHSTEYIQRFTHFDLDIYVVIEYYCKVALLSFLPRVQHIINQ